MREKQRERESMWESEGERGIGSEGRERGGRKEGRERGRGREGRERGGGKRGEIMKKTESERETATDKEYVREWGRERETERERETKVRERWRQECTYYQIDIQTKRVRERDRDIFFRRLTYKCQTVINLIITCL